MSQIDQTTENFAIASEDFSEINASYLKDKYGQCYHTFGKFWFIELEIQENKSTVLYSDPEYSGSGKAWIFNGSMSELMTFLGTDLVRAKGFKELGQYLGIA